MPTELIPDDWPPVDENDWPEIDEDDFSFTGLEDCLTLDMDAEDWQELIDEEGFPELDEIDFPEIDDDEWKQILDNIPPFPDDEEGGFGL